MEISQVTIDVTRSNILGKTRGSYKHHFIMRDFSTGTCKFYEFLGGYNILYNGLKAKPLAPF